MKKIIFLLILTIPFINCSNNVNATSTKPGEDDQLSTAPEAKAEYNASNYGVYKGIFVGSSGTIYVNIYNSGSVSAKMVIEGVGYDFTTSESIKEGQAIAGLTFSSGSSSFDFNVQADGQEPFIDNLHINGHPNPYAQILKEYSFEHIKCYLGTYNGDDSGIFNLAITPDGYSAGLAVPKNDTNTIIMDCDTKGTTITGTFEGGQFSGTINKNTVSGTWQDSTPKSGSWTATRKL